MKRQLTIGLAVILAALMASTSPAAAKALTWSATRAAAVPPVRPAIYVPGTIHRGMSTQRTTASTTPAVKEREIPTLRTRNSRTYAEANGSLKATIYPTAINYRDANGRWMPIDDNLVPAGEPTYAFVNRANDLRLSLPRNLANAPVRVSKAGAFVEFSLEGAMATGQVSGNADRFVGALPAVDVVLAAMADGAKEDLILKNASAPTTFSYQLHYSAGLRVLNTGTGQIDYVDRNGRTVFVTPPAMITDAAGATSTNVGISLTGSQLTMRLDREWLTSPRRAWPIRVDPSIVDQSSGAAQDATITNGPSSCPVTFGPADCIGYGGSQAYRSLLQFDLSSFPATTQVINAYVYLTPLGGSASASIQVDTLQLTQPWTSAATWATTDGTHLWTSAGGTFASTRVYSASSSSDAWYFTKLAQGWVNGTIPNNGILLKATTESGNDVQYYESSYGDCYSQTFSCNLPQLNLNYDPPVGYQSFYTIHDHQLGANVKLSVNLANGNVYVDQQDFTLNSMGINLVGDHFNNTIEDEAYGRWQWLVGYGQVGLEIYGDGSAGLDGASGYVIPFAINADGSFASPPGINSTLVKNSDGTYILSTHATGEKDKFDSSGFLLTRTDQNGNTMSFAYANQCRLSPTSITDTQGRVTTLTYMSGSPCQIVSVTDPAGRTYRYGYDPNTLNLTSYTDAAGDITHFGYLQSGAVYLLNQIVDPVGNITNLGYSSTCGAGGICQLNTQVSSITYVTNRSTGAGYLETFTYNAGSTVVSDANGNKTTFYYDTSGRTTKVVDALGNVVTSAYTGNNDPSQMAGTGSASVKYAYDANNNATSLQASGGLTRAAAYTDATHPYYATQRTNAEGLTVKYAYSAAGQVAQRTDPQGNTTIYTYNANGAVTSITDALGHTTSYQYDQLGNLIKVTYPSPLGSELFGYDSLGRLTSRTDGRGLKTTYAYDVLDRQTLTTFADGTSISAAYDGDGNPTASTDSSGTQTRSYDAMNRLVKQTFPTGQTISYAWDGDGNLLSETDGGGTVSLQYNAINQPVMLVDRGGGKTSLQYNASTNTSSSSYPNGVTETVTTNASHQIVKVSAVDAKGTTLTSFSYTYVNPSTGLPTSMRYGVTDAAGNVTTYGYDAMDRLVSATQKTSGGAVVATYQYGYDAVGNLTSQTKNGTISSYSYNGADQLTQTGTATYTYDAAGNQTGASNGPSFSYNAANQTASITPTGGTAIQMRYSGGGQSQRIQAGSATYQYDLGGVDTMSQGGGSSYFTRLPGGMIASEKTVSGTYYYLHDALGSVVALTDGTGAVVNSYQYDPYGNTTSLSEHVSNPYRWIGAVFDSATGLYKMDERYYSPSLARFTQVDPAHQCVNGYAYAGDNPINASDPSGNWFLGVNVWCGSWSGYTGWGWVWTGSAWFFWWRWDAISWCDFDFAPVIFTWAGILVGVALGLLGLIWTGPLVVIAGIVLGAIVGYLLGVWGFNIPNGFAVRIYRVHQVQNWWPWNFSYWGWTAWKFSWCQGFWGPCG